MTTSALAALVVETRQAHLFRPRKGSPGELDARPYGSGSKRGWVLLDLFTAGAVNAVAKGLKPENLAKLNSLPVPKAVNICWKMVEAR